MQNIQSLLDKITYKPGWSFELISAHEPYTITVAAILKNTRENSEHEYVKMRMAVFCHNQTTEQELLFEIAKTIAEIEVHESLEHFRYDNEIIFDPHQYLESPLVVSKRFLGEI